MNDFDLIIGIHSIAAAIHNSKRSIVKLVLSDEGEQELLKRTDLQKKDLEKITIEKVSGHKVQELAKEFFREKKLEYTRVPSQVFLIASPLEMLNINVFDELDKKETTKILCLDQVSDVHNAGAIIRTAAFYGVDAVVIPSKKSFGLTPSFFRIASGATEYVKLINVSNLGKAIKRLRNLNYITVGLSEHSENPLEEREIQKASRVCIVLGKEDTGISNAVMRQVEYQLSLTPKGRIKSLNVSTAAAITMEKCFK